MKPNSPPSIFNDVIGPVMRGPSSSHTAASVRIGRMVRQMLNKKPSRILFEFHPQGSLATTYENQGSAMGLAAGLLEWDVSHPEMQNAIHKASQSGILLEFRIVPYATHHPSTYKITAEGTDGKKLTCTALSTGGGMIEFIEVDGFQVSLKGDFYESLFICDNLDESESKQILHELNTTHPDDQVIISHSNNSCLINIKSERNIFADLGTSVNQMCKPSAMMHLDPVLPVLSQKKFDLPFSTAEEMLEYAARKNIPLSQLALEYESKRAGITEKEVFLKMGELVEITRGGIEKGLAGTDYADRILGPQSHLIAEAGNANKIIPSPTNLIIAYTSALMEVKSAMGVIIAAPTAGACGVLGGAIFGATDTLDGDMDTITRAFLAAGMIGVFIVDKYTFAAEEGGCQVECGAGSGMAAAGLVGMMNGNYTQAVRAASMALQNMLGLICDPVADRVEVPCLGKNILGATNALNSANMSMAGFDEVIPLDEVIDAMKRVGDEMPASVCCTGLSGLSTTPCSKKIYQEMKEKSEKG